MKLNSKTILITGGGKGIGSELALLLAQHNRVVICGRNTESLKAMASRNKNISWYACDVSQPGQIDTLYQHLAKDAIVLDVLFNNAGVVELWDLKKTRFGSAEIFERMSTNLTGAVAMCNGFLKQANPQKENLLVNITSELALFPIPILPLYSATKAGLRVFTRALRIQLKDTRFRVVEILPPAVDTDMPRSMGNTGKMLNPTQFASDMISKIESGKLEYAPGPNVPLLKFFSRFFSNFGLNLIDKMSRKAMGLR
jgi:uncharacterized oxidoreductase